MIRVVFWIALFLLHGAQVIVAQQLNISVKSEEVRIDVLVTNQGKPVMGLTAADFEVLDNGVMQEIQYVTLQRQTPINTIFVLDMSKSVSGQLLENLKRAASGFLAGLAKDDHAALVMFNHAITLGSPLTQDYSIVKSALDKAQSFGNSSLIDATYAGLMLAQSKPAPALILIFSDGLDTYSWLTSESILKIAKQSEAMVYAVSASSQPNKSFLTDLTRFTGGTLLKAETPQKLASLFLNILDEFRQYYLLTYTPHAVSDSGWHTLEVRVKDHAMKVRARPGYTRR
jgi:VWFA-related protein